MAGPGKNCNTISFCMTSIYIQPSTPEKNLRKSMWGNMFKCGRSFPPTPCSVADGRLKM